MTELLPQQRPPVGDWRVWIILGIRGAGKTHAAASYVADNAHSPVLVGRDRGHLTNVMMEELVKLSYPYLHRALCTTQHQVLDTHILRGINEAVVWLDEPLREDAADHEEAREVIGQAVACSRWLIISQQDLETWPDWFKSFMLWPDVRVTRIRPPQAPGKIMKLPAVVPDLLGMVEDFHKKFGLFYEGPPRQLSDELIGFRGKFMREELDEWEEGNLKLDLEKQLDALVDLLYVLLGTAHLQGFTREKFYEAFRRVHAANMQKVRAEKVDQSKRGSLYDVVKPEGWQPPDLSDLVKG